MARDDTRGQRVWAGAWPRGRRRRTRRRRSDGGGGAVAEGVSAWPRSAPLTAASPSGSGARKVDLEAASACSPRAWRRRRSCVGTLDVPSTAMCCRSASQVPPLECTRGGGGGSVVDAGGGRAARSSPHPQRRARGSALVRGSSPRAPRATRPAAPLAASSARRRRARRRAPHDVGDRRQLLVRRRRLTAAATRRRRRAAGGGGDGGGAAAASSHACHITWRPWSSLAPPPRRPCLHRSRPSERRNARVSRSRASETRAVAARSSGASRNAADRHAFSTASRRSIRRLPAGSLSPSARQWRRVVRTGRRAAPRRRVAPRAARLGSVARWR